MARMTHAYNAERTDVLCAQMSGLMRRQSLQHFQAPPDAFTGLSIGVGSGPQIGIQKGPLRSKFLAQVGRSTLSIFIPPHTRFTEAL
jgi:hypothetical protein